MKHKLQSSIFLQPIDQHFIFTKSNLQEEKLTYPNQNEIKIDCLDNSTESDSGESKNEKDYFSESMCISIRKISSIGENLTEEKNQQLAKNENSGINLKKSKESQSDKNFHVPNFLLFDSEDEIEKSPSSTSSKREQNFGLNLKNSEEFDISNIKKLKKNNNFLKDFCNFSIRENEQTKITNFLDSDWRSKINAQKFLKFNALKKKVFDKMVKSQKKKNKFKKNNNNYLNNNNKNEEKSSKMNNCIKIPFSNLNSNMKPTQNIYQNFKNNYNQSNMNNMNNDNFLSSNNLNNAFNKRKFSYNLNQTLMNPMTFQISNQPLNNIDLFPNYGLPTHEHLNNNLNCNNNFHKCSNQNIQRYQSNFPLNNNNFFYDLNNNNNDLSGANFNNISNEKFNKNIIINFPRKISDNIINCNYSNFGMNQGKNFKVNNSFQSNFYN